MSHESNQVVFSARLVRNEIDSLFQLERDDEELVEKGPDGLGEDTRDFANGDASDAVVGSNAGIGFKGHKDEGKGGQDVPGLHKLAPNRSGKKSKGSAFDGLNCELSSWDCSKDCLSDDEELQIYKGGSSRRRKRQSAALWTAHADTSATLAASEERRSDKKKKNKKQKESSIKAAEKNNSTEDIHSSETALGNQVENQSIADICPSPTRESLPSESLPRQKIEKRPKKRSKQKNKKKYLKQQAERLAALEEA